MKTIVAIVELEDDCDIRNVFKCNGLSLVDYEECNDDEPQRFLIDDGSIELL